ncbi:hypothetical protein GGP41_002130 [Bipolaris sorokiniana]|uniref:Secreted protein n=1 Tax=Cochliobolus sativus TaxID=45130 RepID=A0A8H5ZSV9_COCSA|nr:hypothetical protein GGP41_002130 [Bipolaris sorokiniana]
MHLPTFLTFLLASIIAVTAIEQRGANCDVCVQLFNFCVEKRKRRRKANEGGVVERTYVGSGGLQEDVCGACVSFVST